MFDFCDLVNNINLIVKFKLYASFFVKIHGYKFLFVSHILKLIKKLPIFVDSEVRRISKYFTSLYATGRHEPYMGVEILAVHKYYIKFYVLRGVLCLQRS